MENLIDPKDEKIDTDFSIVKSDVDKDVYIKQFGFYLPWTDSSYRFADSLKQICQNYENSFGTHPTINELEQALQFTRLFLAEIAETCGGKHISHYACELSSYIDEHNAGKTILEISKIRTK